MVHDDIFSCSHYKRSVNNNSVPLCTIGMGDTNTKISIPIIYLGIEYFFLRIRPCHFYCKRSIINLSDAPPSVAIIFVVDVTGSRKGYVVRYSINYRISCLEPYLFYLARDRERFNSTCNLSRDIKI